MAVAIVIPFTLTFIVGRMKLSGEDRFGKETAGAENAADTAAATTESTADTAGNAADSTAVSDAANAADSAADDVKELKSILDGKVMPIEEAPDDVFSQKIMGDGLAIEPSGTVVTAPADCDVSASSWPIQAMHAVSPWQTVWNCSFM